MTVLPYGDDAVLLEVDDVPAAYAAVRAALDDAGASARDVVPAARTVLVDGLRGTDADTLAAAVRRAGAAGRGAGSEPVEVPTTYDGEDLDLVARHWDMTRDEVVATHTGLSFTVAFCGFAPGFAYLAGLPDELAVPRLDSPRSSVPQGSVGLAGPWCGVYPTSSPGGWRLIGRTELALWRADQPNPALLAPGTRVRFVPT